VHHSTVLVYTSGIDAPENPSKSLKYGSESLKPGEQGWYLATGISIDRLKELGPELTHLSNSKQNLRYMTIGHFQIYCVAVTTTGGEQTSTDEKWWMCFGVPSTYGRLWLGLK
jgi:hypothetical protein